MQLELRALQREVGITFVFVTHDQEEALTLSDRVAVMSQGRMVQCSPPLELYERPQSRFAAEFVGEMNFFPGRVVASAPHTVASICRVWGLSPVPTGRNVKPASRSSWRCGPNGSASERRRVAPGEAA